MDKCNKIGKLGEQLAEKYLIKNNYIIIEKNYKCKFGEIDIITYKNKQLIFVEVKTRNSKKYGTGLSAIDKIKQLHMYRSALYYLYEKNINCINIRFDAVEVDLYKYKYQYNIKQYFDIFQEDFC